MTNNPSPLFPPPTDTNLTVRQAAAKVPCHAKLIYEKIANGELRAIRLGPRTIRVRQSDLDAYMAARETIPEQTPASRRRELLDPDTIAFLSELAEHASALTEEQKDAVRAAFRDGGTPPPFKMPRPVPRPKRARS